MNKVSVCGNLTADIQIGSNDKGAYAHFTVASDNGKRENAGTSFLRIAAFGDGTADLAKGTFVKVVGSIRTGEYDGKPTMQIVARKIERVERKEKAA
ncbi:MAG: single-stranded DNA-binding protein [Vulcanimicrobiaceae bacterium]